jgi:hypothetical protein
MQRKSIVGICFIACNAFLISSVIAGCSGADDQAAPNGTAEQRIEDTQPAPCEGAQGEPVADLENAEVTLDPTDNAKGTVSLNACVCCSSLQAAARKYCSDRGRPLAYAYCGGVCGLCGCDNAYSYIDFGCR